MTLEFLRHYEYRKFIELFYIILSVYFNYRYSVYTAV